MKKIYIWLALVLLIALIVTACSSASTPTQTSPIPTATAITENSNTPSSTGTAPTTHISSPSSSVVSPTVSSTPAAVSGPKYGGTIEILTGVLPDGIFGYPAETINGASVRIQGHVTEGLVKMGWDGQLTPLLATSWDVSPDNTSIIFRLRKGVKFTDGTDFNAQAVKWNYDTVIAAKRVTTWKSIEVLDDYTVKVNYIQPGNIYLQSFADSGSMIVSPTAFQKYGKQGMYANIYSTAAFTISDFSRDVSVTMVKNPNYWQSGKPYLDGLSYNFVQDNMTAWAYMMSGGADVWWTSAEYVSQAVPKGFGYVSQAGGSKCLVPDSANADSPWSKLEVRQAAEYAIDKEAIASAFGYGFAKAPYQIATPGTPGYDPDFQGRKYDPAKAKQLLSQAGYPNGFKTTIICQVASNTNNNEVLAIQANLKAVGIDAAVQYYETAKYYEFRNGTWHNGLVFEPIAAYGNYNSTLNLYFAPNSALFLSLAKSDAWKKAFNDTIRSPYVDANLMKQAVKVFYDDAMAIPTSSSSTFWMLQPSSKIRDLGLLTRHLALFFNAEDAWLDK